MTKSDKRRIVQMVDKTLDPDTHPAICSSIVEALEANRETGADTLTLRFYEALRDSLLDRRSVERELILLPTRLARSLRDLMNTPQTAFAA